MASPRKFSKLLFSCLYFSLFTLSTISLAPIIIIKSPPTPLGYAFIFVSIVSIVSAFLGFFSRFTQSCLGTHLSLLLGALVGQLFAFLALFLKEKRSLTLLKSPRDPREAKVLVRLECVIFMVIFVLQVCVFVITCVVHSCWVREYKCLEAEKEVNMKKRNEKISKVYEESKANSEKLDEIKENDFDEKMRSKYGKWVKTDIEV